MRRIYVLHLILYLFFISILMIVGRMCTNVTSSYNEEVLLFQFLFQHILVHSFSCMCGTSSFDKEVPVFLKCHVLLCRGGPVFSILVSTNQIIFISGICGTFSSNEEVPELSKFYVLV